MIFNISQIAIMGIAYLMLLFAIATATKRGWISSTITNHPLTYVLSLGIFFSAWSYYGVIDLAYNFGYASLAYYMGTGAFFLLSPIVQAPLANLCQRFHLRSIADLLVFRYNSQLAGVMATLFIAMALIPLLILQIQAVADTLTFMTNTMPEGITRDTQYLNLWEQERHTFAFFYCMLITTFCIIYGAGIGQHKALITTMAFESLVKLIALTVVGLFSVYFVFGGFAELDTWLLANPEFIDGLYTPKQDVSSHILLLIFIATGVLMPHIFQMSHMDRSINQLSRMLTWAFPLFLLFMALPVFPILWAGFKLGVPYDIAYFTLGVPQFGNSQWVTILAWVGGLSAASGAMIVSLMSLATMMQNQWVLPFLNLKTQADFYAQLRWLRRVIIIVIALTCYGFYLYLDNNYSLLDLALISFIQALQFVPGIIAIGLWPRANRFGFYWGITAGSLVWLIGLVIPVFLNITAITLPFMEVSVGVGIADWEVITLLSIGLNIACFVGVSYFTEVQDEDLYQAEVCAEDELSQPFRRTLEVKNVGQFKEKLALSIGKEAAENEVNRSLKYLGLQESETRPYALRRLRTRIRTNLTGLLGQSVAKDIIDRHFPYRARHQEKMFDINLMEARLDRLGSKMQGLSKDINKLRLHHRKTLQELPVALCSIGLDDEILLWNHAMARLTGISSLTVTGSIVTGIGEPWGAMINEFTNNDERVMNKQIIGEDNKTRWYRLHQSQINEMDKHRIEGQVIIIEDITDIQLLEQELIHNTRLASIGRLAAGVAHEIGNPVTGIACLAQNLRYEEDRQEQIDSADAILSQTDRITKIVQSLVSFAQTGSSAQKGFEPVNLKDCINEAIHLLSLQKDRKPIEYQNNTADDVIAWGDSQRLMQVFVNMLSNANDASPEFSTIILNTQIKDGHIEIDITDEGMGIPAAAQKQIMEPFFTTKDTGKGTGLGLSIVFNIIEEHHGSIALKSPIVNGRGTCFTIKLPQYNEILMS